MVTQPAEVVTYANPSKAWRQAKRRARKAYAPYVLLAVVAVLACGWAFETYEPDVKFLGRKLLSSEGCDKDALKGWEENGGVVLYLFGVIYLFVGIAIICDDYFVNSLKDISEALSLSEDVAGATFMAAGSSAPELFSSLMSLTNPNAGEGIGIGTIVGSAVFNILVIIGVTAVFAGRVLHLDWKPMLRDGLFYSASIVSLLIVFEDQTVHWWEGLIFCALYGSYIAFMQYNARVMAWLDAKFGKPTEAAPELTTIGSNRVQPDDSQSAAPAELTALAQDGEDVVAIKQNTLVGTDVESGGTDAIKAGPAESTVTAAGEEEEEDTPFWKRPEKAQDWPLWLLSYPWNVAFFFTTPNCKYERFRKWYLVTFIGSIAWIGIISWFMVAWAAKIGCILDIPDAIMGVTVLAAGTSIPDALSSIVVARQGMGDMAVANAVGSNVFDIWLGLGLPWLFVLGIREAAGSSNSVIVFGDSSTMMVVNVLILFGVLLTYLLVVMATGWRLTSRIGIAFMLGYVLYVIYYIAFVWRMDIFGQD